MLPSTNIRMLQKHLKVATFEGSFESNTFVYALLWISENEHVTHIVSPKVYYKDVNFPRMLIFQGCKFCG